MSNDLHKEFQDISKKVELWKRKFDKWRLDYDTLTCSDQQEFYTQLTGEFPIQSQHNKENVSYFFKNIDLPYPRVLEMGGWDGELADYILSKNSQILRWDNYEITEYARKWNRCHDSRYTVNIPNDFIWNIILPEHYNIFLSSHTIEHIKGEDFVKLINNLPDNIQYIYLEADLPIFVENMDWTGDFSTHILEYGWEKISKILKDIGYDIFFASKGLRVYRK